MSLFSLLSNSRISIKRTLNSLALEVRLRLAYEYRTIKTSHSHTIEPLLVLSPPSAEALVNIYLTLPSSRPHRWLQGDPVLAPQGHSDRLWPHTGHFSVFYAFNRRLASSTGMVVWWLCPVFCSFMCCHCCRPRSWVGPCGWGRGRGGGGGKRNDELADKTGLPFLGSPPNPKEWLPFRETCTHARACSELGRERPRNGKVLVQSPLVAFYIFLNYK
jgi:hypothetical protein